MEIALVRLQNLHSLATRYNKEMDFCSAAGLIPSYWSQLKAYGVPGAAQYKTLGSKKARQIEESMGLERGWLDVVHGAAMTGSPQSPGDVRQAGELSAAVQAMATLPPNVQRQINSMIFTLASEFSLYETGVVDGFSVQAEGRRTAQPARKVSGGGR